MDATGELDRQTAKRGEERIVQMERKKGPECYLTENRSVKKLEEWLEVS